MTRPNILLVTSDQHRGDCYGFEGRAVHTPHLDLLAAQGTRFAACITPNVVCMPARASMLTGLLPLTHGTHDNGIDLDEAVAERGFAGAHDNIGRHATQRAHPSEIMLGECQRHETRARCFDRDVELARKIVRDACRAEFWN